MGTKIKKVFFPSRPSCYPGRKTNGSFQNLLFGKRHFSIALGRVLWSRPPPATSGRVSWHRPLHGNLKEQIREPSATWKRNKKDVFPDEGILSHTPPRAITPDYTVRMNITHWTPSAPTSPTKSNTSLRILDSISPRSRVKVSDAWTQTRTVPPTRQRR